MIDSSAVGLPMMLFTFLGVLAATPLALYAAANRKRALLEKIGMAAALWAGLYVILLLLASLVSSDRVLPRGERLSFCGFYLDCHIGARVTAVTSVPEIRAAGRTFTARDTYCVVEVTFENNARRMPLRLSSEPEVSAVVGDLRLQPSADVSEALRKASGRQNPIGLLDPHGGSISTVYVFDTAASQAEIRLLVRSGDPADRLVELFLIGDDDSMMHAKTYLSLGT